MARGRLLKSKVREAKKIVEALTEGQIKAEKKKDLQLSLREHLGRMIDRVDPMDMVAVLALTTVIYDVLSRAKAIKDILAVV